MSLLADLIDPLDGLIGRFVYGPMHRFTIATESGITGYDIEMLLRQYGVRIWGRDMSDPDEIALLVKAKQAVWAEYLLCRANMPLTCELLDPNNERYRPHEEPKQMPDPWSKKGIGPHSLVDHAVDWIARLAS